MPKAPKYTERELVEGCVRNDRHCQEFLYRQYFESMMRMCLRYTHDRDLAMEIVNTGLLRVYKKLHTFQFKGSLEGWIRKLVFHSLSDHFKRKEKKVFFLEIEDRDVPVAENVLNKLYLEDILKLVDQLPNATREVFVLYAIDGYTHVEIGKMLGISEGTSKWHLSNARKKLKLLIRQFYNQKNYAR